MSGSVEEGTPPASAELLAELGAMKFRALQKRAEKLGVGEDKLDEADEKSEVIELIVQQIAEIAAREKAERNAELLAELGAMKFRALQKRAEELGVGEDKLDEADEKSEVIALILVAMAPVEDGAAAAAAEAEAVRLAQLKEELAGMKMRALQKRAEELGVDEDKLDEADEKSEVIALILAAMAPVEDGAAAVAAEAEAASAAAAAAEAEAARLTQLKEELAGMKMRALQTRAEELGVDGAALDEADDKSAVIELIMVQESTTVMAPTASHFGSASNTVEMADAMSAVFAQWKKQGLHIMLSYQWDVQKEVKAVHALLQKKKIPVWMDVNGGMAADIYDSVSTVVFVAAVRVLCLTVRPRVRRRWRKACRMRPWSSAS
jgi:hypothetical protein